MMEKKINSATLKHIAIILMIINHFGYLLSLHYNYDGFFYDLQWFITRPAFVIFAFQISEGLYKTHDRNKYCLRLLLLAFISEPFFDLALNNSILDFESQNVFFTLFLGAYSIKLIDENENKLIKYLIFFITIIISLNLRADYDFMGVLVIYAFYFLRGNYKKMFIVVACILYFGYFGIYTYELINNFNDYFHPVAYNAIMELHGILAFPLIYLYNGEKGKMLNKWFYYYFYPLHLLIIYLLLKVI